MNDCVLKLHWSIQKTQIEGCGVGGRGGGEEGSCQQNFV